jgi:hypothetical protein
VDHLLIVGVRRSAPKCKGKFQTAASGDRLADRRR